MARNSHITASHPLPWLPVNSPCVAGPAAPAHAVQGPLHTHYLTCGEDAPSEFRVIRVTLLPMFWLPDCPQLETESLASDPLSPSSLWLSSWPGTFTTMVFCRRPGTALRGNRDTSSVVRAARQHAETVLHARSPSRLRETYPSTDTAPQAFLQLFLLTLTAGSSLRLQETEGNLKRLKEVKSQQAVTRGRTHGLLSRR